MPLTIPLTPKKIALTLVAIALILAVMSIGGKHIEAAAGTEHPHILSQLVRIFNINRESSIPTWYATVLLFTVACLLAIIAYGERVNQGRYRRHWTGLGIIFLYLSVDEAAALHEKLTVPVGEALNATGYLYFSWVIVAAPLVIVFALVYLKFLLHLPPGTRNLFILAGALYIGAAIGIEAVGANRWYQDDGSSLLYSTIGTVEEFFEMAGIIVLLYALLDYAGATFGAVEFTVGAAETKLPIQEEKPG